MQTRRFKKELRPLIAPWIVASFTLLLSGRPELARDGGDTVPRLLTGVCILLIAAQSFGHEFHNRTLGLLLAQPVERGRIFWEKLLALGVVGLSLCMVVVGDAVWAGVLASSGDADSGRAVLFHILHELLESRGLLLGGLGLFVISTFSSAAFWALAARSVVGAAALSGFSQFLVLLASQLWLADWLTKAVDNTALAAALACLLAAIGYAAVFGVLGRRWFIRAEWRGNASTTAGSDLGIVLPGMLRRATECRPSQPWLNLLRKELWLQRPLFLLATVFVCSLLALLGAHYISLWSGRGGMSAGFNVLFFVYVPLALLLAGTTPFTEEAELGTHPAHLLTPKPAWRLFATKLIVACSMAAILAALLPGAALLTLAALGVWPESTKPSEIEIMRLVCLAGVFFLMALWVAPIVRNAVKACLAGLVLVAVQYLVFGAALSWGGDIVSVLNEPLIGTIQQFASSSMELQAMLTFVKQVAPFVMVVLIAFFCILQAHASFKSLRTTLPTLALRVAALESFVFLMVSWLASCFRLLGAA